MNVSTITATGNRKPVVFLAALFVTIVVAATYWPAIHAGFVWDDVVDFQNRGWLTQGDAWKHFIWKDFNNWINYFRPLVVGLFTIQLRVFGVRPEPMHAVSLVIHLINTLLVGLLAWQLSASKWPGRGQWLVLAIPMLLYGLHPVLIEPVAWIGCQFDLVATLFMLLGLTLNVAVRGAWVRALCVALCFFLAACSKESAAVFPLILVVFDWVVVDVPRGMPMRSQLKTLLEKNLLTYIAVIAAAVAYLVLRYWALGSLSLNADTDKSPAFARLQEVSYLYLHYWRTIFWPMQGMNPLHPVPPGKFLVVDAISFLSVMLALGMVLVAVLLAMRRFVIGSVVLAVTFALLPVLHIVAATLDTSLYHERYAMTALAVVCALLPLVLHQMPNIMNASRTISWVIGVALVFWLSLSIVNIRVTLPLWSTQVKLWEWAMRDNPDDIEAMAQLTAAYVGAGDSAKVWRLTDEVVAGNVPCTYCMLNAALFAIKKQDMRRAEFYLDRVQNAPDLYALKFTYATYLTERSELLLFQGNPRAAERVARMAISLDNLNPDPQLVLVSALAKQGRVAEAKAANDAVMPLLSPESREERRKAIDRILAGPGPGSPNAQSGEPEKQR